MSTFRGARTYGPITEFKQIAPDIKTLDIQSPGFDAVALLKYPHLERITHVHHAGNSSGIVDGAAAVLVGSRAFGARHGLTPRARIRASARVGSDPTIMLTGPVPVTEKILKDSGMSISDIDLFEVNEAFAPVPLAWQAETGADPQRVNPLGGAIALGHPLGASGAVLMTRMVHHMRDNGIRYGLQTMCEGGGTANATLVELVN